MSSLQTGLPNWVGAGDLLTSLDKCLPEISQALRAHLYCLLDEAPLPEETHGLKWCILCASGVCTNIYRYSGKQSISGQVASVQFGLPGPIWKMIVLVTETSLSFCDLFSTVQFPHHLQAGGIAKNSGFPLTIGPQNLAAPQDCMHHMSGTIFNGY